MNGMRPKPVVVALGGNAFVRPGLPPTMAGQFDVARTALVPLLEFGERPLVVTHGNGPQVGHMLIRVQAALGRAYAVPLEVCVAESDGELGYVIQQTLQNLFREAGRKRTVAAVLTEVLVAADDPAFLWPTKPIGPFLSEEQARVLQAGGSAVVEDAGRGWRRVVPSPRPLEIVDVEAVECLLQAGVLVVAAGGGGIPVVERAGRLEGIEAVVDKDLASALLAERIGAELLAIVTGVPCAFRDFGTDRQQAIGRTTVAELRQLLDEGHFPPGSMGPKIKAAAAFAERPGRTAIVCDPASLSAALAGRAGTIVTAD